MLSKTNTTSSFIKATINISKLTKECETARFAVIYLDELNQIMSYKSLNSKDAYMNVDVILLVFAYLRMKIYRRRNELMPEENNLDNKNSLEYDIESRRKRCPEVYDCFYYEIADDLGLSARVISKAIDVLNELGLIYSEALPRIKHEDKWRTDHTLFCNTYKREKNYLLDTGENYYLREIANKKKKLNINT
jgi:DNA-binding transcriptional ArsR family regulator